MRITFIIRDVWGMGGTIKATLNNAAALAARGHDVTIASVVRSRTEPVFPIDPRITVVNLWDRRKAADGGESRTLLDRWRARRPSIMDECMVNPMGASSALFDHRVAKYLRKVDTDVLIATHPSLGLYLARRRSSAAAIVQEHASFDRHKQPVQEWIKADYPHLDAIVTATETDAGDYREALPDFAGPIEAVPNLLPRTGIDREIEPGPIVMAAGRLIASKGFDTLIRAFSRTDDRFGRWRLRIYGQGKEQTALEQLIDDTRSENRTELMGPVAPLDSEWAKAAIAVVPSHHESFGLSMAEAMSAGVPVIAAAVPHGPREVVEHEFNGLLVTPRDVGALTEALERLMGDRELRGKLASAGRETAWHFEAEQVAGRYEELFERLLDGRV
ncbi:glycosyltransferase [Glycomyces sp. L485]|uniref:glycosyltransferase n=1 Tax=Glycomyces sp. L485 TaxID=2909235 RepID=UPI001F4B094F|nr:glycosyltransferase [Glycomyces sp. L485]MCH7233094.1 glycosyltransferase [Glycomyces sp. L485]